MRAAAIAVLMLTVLAATARPAHAQESLSSVLSFLLTNRSVSTGDFVGDQLAAAAARDALVGFLQAELATLPTTSPAGGFVYRLDPTIGAMVRVSNNFGPFFMERSLTIGSRQAAIGAVFTSSSFNAIDGRNLRDGTLVSTASRFVGETTPFDAETLTLNLRTQTITLSGTYGFGDRFDVSAALPFVTVNMDGQRVDTYRGDSVVQATATASASGIGDMMVRGKFNVFQHGASGIAVVGEMRLPTGNEDNLLGSGETIITPRVIGSFEHDRIALHGSAGYSFGGSAEVLAVSGAFTVSATPHITFTAECLGRRVASGGELIDVVQPNPSLTGVETIRLSAAPLATTQVVVVGGIRWNPYGRWLVSGNVLHPLTTAGLNARWVGSLTVDYSFGR